MSTTSASTPVLMKTIPIVVPLLLLVLSVLVASLKIKNLILKQQ